MPRDACWVSNMDSASPLPRFLPCQDVNPIGDLSAMVGSFQTEGRGEHSPKMCKPLTKLKPKIERTQPRREEEMANTCPGRSNMRTEGEKSNAPLVSVP